MIDNADKTARLEKHPSESNFRTQKAIGVGVCLKQRFVLEEEIGRGGMGLVYRALDLRKQELNDKDPYIAIKLISSKLKKIDDSMIALQREAKKAQKLAHPNIATVYDFDRDGEHAFLCMELLSGEPLADHLKKLAGQPLPHKDVIPIIQGMAEGLAYAHSQGILHADFKPGNIFITSNGVVKILDFGVARAITTDSQHNEHTLFDPGKWKAVTPAYASPEMFEQSATNPRDDIYALGCICYELLQGEHPYYRTPANLALAQGLTPIKIKGLSRKMHATLRRSVDLEQHKRVSSVAEFLEGVQLQRSITTKHVVWAASILICTLFIGYWQNSPSYDASLENKQNLWFAKPTTVDKKTQEKIAILLELAKLHASVGRYISPPTSNAAEAYYSALTLQPGNPDALEGANAIARSVLKKANALKQQNDDERAIELVKETLHTLKNNPDLLDFLQSNLP